MFDRFTAGVLGVVLSAALASAQATISVSGGAVLTAGDSVQITYENRARANGTVVVVVDDGELPNTTQVEIVIQLDAQGRGVGTWSVQSWWVANFNAPGARQVSCVVN